MFMPYEVYAHVSNLINELYTKSECIQVYEGSRASV